MLSKTFELSIDKIYIVKNYAIYLCNQFCTHFGTVRINNYKAKFTLIEFNTIEERNVENCFRVPLQTTCVFIKLRRINENGSVEALSSLESTDVIIAKIPFESTHFERYEVIDTRKGEWERYKHLESLCISQKIDLETFLYKFQNIPVYQRETKTKDYFLSVFKQIRKDTFLVYKNDTALLTNNDKDIWNPNISSSHAGDCEDFTAFYLHVFNCLKMFWNFIHNKLLKQSSVPKNICLEYQPYFTLSTIDGEGHCRFCLLSEKEKIFFEATALNNEKYHTYEDLIAFDAIKPVILLRNA